MSGARVPWRLVALAISVVVVSTQPVFLLGAAYLRIGPELDFGTTGLGVLTAAFFLSASVASAPLGRVVQRVGWRQAVRVNATGSGVILVLIATTAHSLTVFATLIVAGGLVYGLANPAANLALAEHVDPSRRAMTFGLKHAGIPASTLLAGLAIPAIVLHFGWRVAYLLVTVLGALVWLLTLGDFTAPEIREEDNSRRRVEPMPTRLLIRLALAASLATWGAIALSTYLVATAVDRGFTEAAAGWLLFGGSAASIAARVTVGYFTDRTEGRGFGAMTVLTAIGVVVFLVFGAVAGAAFVILVPVAFATGWGWPGLMTFTVVNANTGSAAQSSGITQAGIFFGAGAGPIVLGIVADRWGFTAIWMVVAGTLAMASLAIATVGRAAAARTGPG
jgi:predicted MFS family arabinose efflux permease